ncbi:hypothetical protein BGW38_002807 [Lunasporangiospora selenospora]|uniref:Uncharacterized protein n=1 Tax=Lunasporangiospora selenospora TaxID=979761 RepID=A0A9P6KD97_9FUNG|nr:hypothetical protein BGW38_002807 [Lunasporangiospora selenospora]
MGRKSKSKNSPAMITSGSSTNNNKTTPLAISPAVSAKKKNVMSTPAVLSIEIPAAAHKALQQASAYSPPASPPMLSDSPSSTTSFDSLPSPRNMAPTTADIAAANAAAANAANAAKAAAAHAALVAREARRLSQQYFFPNRIAFESAAPAVVRAKDLQLKDHSAVDHVHTGGSHLYNGDSRLTRDGRPLVRLL